MERQSIAAIAAVAERLPQRPVLPEKEEVPGAPFGLLPVQRWFFEQQFEEPHHWNQSLLLEPTEAIDEELLRRALQVLVQHHRALRLAFRERDGEWQQSYQADLSFFERLDLSAVADRPEAVRAAADAAQRSLTSTQPFRALWMDLGPKHAGRLLLVAHHLVVDGVSWRILLEDLQSLYQQLRDTGTTQPLPSSTSLRRWTQELQAYAQSDRLEQERPYWMALGENPGAELPVRDAQGSNTVADTDSLVLTLDEHRTEQLLTQASQAYRGQPDELLLTALAETVCDWSRQDSVLIELEGHGRQELSSELDLTRTVGWFTSLFPVCLSPRSEPQLPSKQSKSSSGACLIKESGTACCGTLANDGAALGQKARPRITFQLPRAVRSVCR